MRELLLGSPPSWSQAIVLDAFCSACDNEAGLRLAFPRVKGASVSGADRDRIRRIFFNRLLSGASQVDQQATAVLVTMFSRSHGLGSPESFPRQEA